MQSPHLGVASHDGVTRESVRNTMVSMIVTTVETYLFAASCYGISLFHQHGRQGSFTQLRSKFVDGINNFVAQIHRSAEIVKLWLLLPPFYWCQ